MKRILFGVGTTPLLLGLLALSIVPAAAATLGVTADKLTTLAEPTSVSGETCTLTASVDTYVNQSDAGGSFGGAATLLVRSKIQDNARTLVKFAFTSCPDFSNALITAADLSLHLESAPSAQRNYGAHRVTSSWDGTTTWGTQPTFLSSATETIATVASGNAMTWDVSADVQAFVDGTSNEGWLVKDASEDAILTGPGAAIGFLGTFSSGDQSSNPKPTLVVSYYP